MTPRLLLALLQPLLALLLLAGAPAAGRGAAEGASFVRIERALESVGLTRAGAEHEAGQAEIRGVPERSGGGDDGPAPASTAVTPHDVALDRARFIRIGLSAYPTAPPSHRPCAAPPTGPPSA